MSLKKRFIGVLPLGEVPEIALNVISTRISDFSNFTIHILPPMKHPEYAFDERRFQYDAGIIIEALESMQFNDYEKVVGILDLDLFIPIFTHVFGEARQGGKFALVSLFRLGKSSDGSVPGAGLIYERAAKVVLHELGHLFNLLHCENKRCLMHFSGCVEELDESPFDLCEYCSIYLQDEIHR